MYKLLLALCLSFALALPVVAAAGPAAPIDADSLDWTAAPSPLPDGVLIAFLEGDPTSGGMHTFRLRVPAGTLLDAHWHPFDERITVLSGSLEFGMGHRGEDSSPRKFGAGDFFIAEQRKPHYLFFVSDSVLQVTGLGAWETHEAAAAQNAKSEAEIRIIKVSPPEGSVLTPDTEIEVEVEYSVVPFRPSTFMLMFVFNSVTEGESFGIRQSGAVGEPPTPPRENILKEATGRTTVRVSLRDIGRYMELSKPYKMRVLINEMTTPYRSRSVATSPVIEFADR